ncbi:MAG: lipid-A-disaccharide synthase, partial [Candidatus Binataceae bacterium]
LGRMLITGVDYIGMPNILAGRKIVPELVQYQVTAANFVRAAEPLLNDSIRNETVAALDALRERLGSPGAAARVAELALGMVA